MGTKLQKMIRMGRSALYYGVELAFITELDKAI